MKIEHYLNSPQKIKAAIISGVSLGILGLLGIIYGIYIILVFSSLTRSQAWELQIRNPGALQAAETSMIFGFVIGGLFFISGSLLLFSGLIAQKKNNQFRLSSQILVAFCTSCGARIDSIEETVFCSSCGAKQ